MPTAPARPKPPSPPTNPLRTQMPSFWRRMGSDGLALGLNRTVFDPLRRVGAGLSGGAEWVGTAYGTGLEFSSDGDEVYLGDAFDPSGASGFTFGALIRPAGTTSGKPWGSWNDTSSQQQWLISTSTDFRAYVRTTADIQELSISSNRPSISANEWAYLVARFDGNAGQGDVWKNGVKYAGNSFTPDTVASVTPFVKLGAGGSDGVTQTQFAGRVLLSWATRQALPDEEVERISAEQNWLAPFTPRRRVLVSVAGGGTNVSVSTAALTLATFAATVNAETNVAVGTAALTITTHAATVNAATDVQVGTASLTLATHAATVNAETNVQAAAASLTLTTYTATITAPSADTNVSVSTAALTLTTHAATVNAETHVQAGTASLTLATLPASVQLHRTVDVGTAALTLSTLGADVTLDVGVQVATVSLNLTTYAATVVGGAVIDIEPPYTAAWVDPARTASWTDPARTGTWTDPARTATWEE